MAVIKLNGTRNMRDFSGIKNKDGKTLIPGKFIRSEKLNKIDDLAKSQLFSRYGLRKIVDLRTAYERDEKPDAEIAGVENLNIPIFSEEVMGITHGERTDGKDMLKHLPDMTELYRTMFKEPDCVRQFKKVFEVITGLGDDESVLWHCTEGKDRCGLTSALFMALMDFSYEEIEKDYLMTNLSAEKRAKTKAMMVRVLCRDKKAAATVRVIFTARKEYLKAAFDVLDDLYGGVDSFIENQLGISKEVKEQMKKKYLI